MREVVETVNHSTSVVVLSGQQVPAPFSEGGVWIAIPREPGEPERAAMLEPAQARELAAALQRAADEVEQEEANVDRGD